MSRKRSNTLGSKGKDEESLPIKQTMPSAQAPMLIKIGMRVTNKPIKYIEILSLIHGGKLFDLAEREFYLDQAKQILFLRGERILPEPEFMHKLFQLSQKDIIHIHNKDNMSRSQITIYLHVLNTQLIKIHEQKLTISPHTKIKQALSEALLYKLEDASVWKFVQSGRFLNGEATFWEEAVEGDSSILVVERNVGGGNGLIGGWVGASSGKLEDREIQIAEGFRRAGKRGGMSLEPDDQPNFKKKPKSRVYRSIYRPESKQIVWEEDSNSNFSQKVLMKRIQKQRKNSGLEKLQSFKELSNQAIFSSTKKGDENFDRTKPQAVIKKQQPIQRSKLAFSQILTPRVQRCQQKSKPNTNLKTPPTISCDMFEEAEQMQFGCCQTEQLVISPPNPQPIEMGAGTEGTAGTPTQVCLNSSAPLSRQAPSLASSIGKLKGVFIPIIPRTLLADDSDSDDDDEEEGYKYGANKFMNDSDDDD